MKPHAEMRGGQFRVKDNAKTDDDVRSERGNEFFLKIHVFRICPRAVSERQT